jgi:hypothetical protein
MPCPKKWQILWNMFWSLYRYKKGTSIFLIGSRLLDTLFLIDYWFRLSCTSLHQLLVHLIISDWSKIFRYTGRQFQRYVAIYSCTKILCSAPKSGAGLRIEYKFIIQSKQCIEKSLTLICRSLCWLTLPLSRRRSLLTFELRGYIT